MSTPLEAYQNYKSGRVEKILSLLIKESRHGRDEILQEAIKDNIMSRIIETKKYELIAEFISVMDGNILLYQSIHQPLFEVQDILVLHHLALKLCQLPELIPVFYQNNKFPVLDGLVQFVHLEGERGELSRVAFELLVKIDNAEVQEYIFNSEFSSIVIASLCGLYCQLPESITKANLKPFISFYEFLQSCITYAKTNVQQALLFQFQTLFLDQVVQSGIQASSDFDGTTHAWLFYALTMLDLTNNGRMLQAITESFFKESDGQDLNVRDILLSKLTSLSESVVIGVLNLITTVLKKWDGAIYVLFPDLERQEEMSIQVSEHVQIVNRLLEVCTNKQGLEQYVTEAVGRLHEIATKRQPDTSKPTQEEETVLEDDDQMDACEQLEKIENSSLWNKLYDKLQTLYSQSMNVNLALTGLVSTISLEPHPLIYRLVFFSSKNIVTPVITLCQEIPTSGGARMRMDLIRKELERGNRDSEWSEEREKWNNCVVVEEFVKEVVGGLMMRGSTNREHISYV